MSIPCSLGSVGSPKTLLKVILVGSSVLGSVAGISYKIMPLNPRDSSLTKRRRWRTRDPEVSSLPNKTR